MKYLKNWKLFENDLQTTTPTEPFPTFYKVMEDEYKQNIIKLLGIIKKPEVLEKYKSMVFYCFNSFKYSKMPSYDFLKRYMILQIQKQ